MALKLRSFMNNLHKVLLKCMQFGHAKNSAQSNDVILTLKMRFVSCMRRSAIILILNREGIIEKISYERRAYESVDEKSLYKVMSRKTKKKRIHAFKG